MFKRIAHVCLGARDLERSVAYYRLLGFEELFRFTRKGREFGVYMALADGNFIEIFEDPDLTSVVNNGILHFCLEADDLDAVMATLAERGVSFTPKKMGVDEHLADLVGGSGRQSLRGSPVHADQRPVRTGRECRSRLVAEARSAGSAVASVDLGDRVRPDETIAGGGDLVVGR